MQSVQINTSPLLRNFATRMPDKRIQVSTKLGTQTLLRVDFPLATYPETSTQQLEFLLELISRTNPAALDLLSDVASRCIDDQRRAISNLMIDASATQARA